MSACKTNALKRPEIGQPETRMYVRARSGRENVNGCLRYSLCLKFMQNTYFGILDIARNPREGRGMRYGSRVNLQIA